METTSHERPLPSHYQYCFGCGAEHPTGLHIQMSALGDRVRGSFTVTEHHQGAPGLAHGGVIAAAMDEGMGYVLYLLGTMAVTANLNVNFRKPVPVGSTLQLEGGVNRVEGRKIFVELSGRLNGEVAVDATALFLKVDVEHFIPHAQKLGVEMSENLYNP